MLEMDKIKEEALYYINNEVTFKEASEYFNISLRTFQLHMKRLLLIDEELHRRVQFTKAKRELEGKKKGGERGKRSTTWTPSDAAWIANLMISHDYSFSELSQMTGIARSTIYEMINSEYISKDLRDKIDDIIYAHTHNMSTFEYESRIQESNRRL